MYWVSQKGLSLKPRRAVEDPSHLTKAEVRHRSAAAAREAAGGGDGEEGSWEDVEDDEDAMDEEELRRQEVLTAQAAAQRILGAGSGGRGGSGGEAREAGDVEDEDAKIQRLYNFDKYYPDDENVLPGGLTGELVMADGEKDPYLVVDPDEDDESDIDDFTIRPTDSLLLIGKTEDDFSTVEMHVYEDDEAHLYVHHDFILPAFPLALAYLDFCPGSSEGARGNFLAVCTFRPEIEIWDLDEIDGLDPAGVLGGFETEYGEALARAQAAVNEEEGIPEGDGEAKPTKASKKGKDEKKPGRARRALEKLAKSPVFAEGSHTDSVLSVSWNPSQRNILASGSADGTVKVWDLAQLSCVATLTHHAGKVQTVAWNPAEPTVLLTASFDRTAAVVDVRSGSLLRFDITADAESAAWDPHNPGCFFAATEAGRVLKFDVQRAVASQGAGTSVEPVFTIHAHDDAVSAMALSPDVPNLLATGSTDLTVKLWACDDNRPSCIFSRNFGVGPVFSLAFSPDTPLKLAIAGGKGKVMVWDCTDRSEVRRRYSDVVAKISSTNSKRETTVYDGLDHAKEMENTVQSMERMAISSMKGGRGGTGGMGGEEDDDGEGAGDGSEEGMAVDGGDGDGGKKKKKGKKDGKKKAPVAAQDDMGSISEEEETKLKLTKKLKLKKKK